MLTGCVSLFQVNLRNFIEQIIGYKSDAQTETDQRLPTNWSLSGFIGRQDSNRWWHLPKTKIGCLRMVRKFLSKQNATGYIRDKSRHHQVDGTPLDKKTPLGSEFAQDQTRNDAVGFLPGHASLAYFFFRGSSGSSNWASRL